MRLPKRRRRSTLAASDLHDRRRTIDIDDAEGQLDPLPLAAQGLRYLDSHRRADAGAWLFGAVAAVSAVVMLQGRALRARCPDRALRRRAVR